MSPADGRAATRITPYRDGPYVIRGTFEVVDQDGNVLPLSRRTIALCRCGRSQLRPFCDGTHKAIGFRAPSNTDRPLAREEHERA